MAEVPPNELPDHGEDDTRESPQGVGLSRSSDLAGGMTSTSRATALLKASEEFTRHRLPQRGAMSAVIPWLISTVLGVVFTRVDFDPRVQDRVRQANTAGTLIYVFQTVSLLDYLYFNWVFLRSGLPLAEWANGLTTMVMHRLSVWLRHLWHRGARRKPSYDLAALDHCVKHNRPVWLNLSRAKDSDEANLAFSQPALLRLMQLQHNIERPLVLVPLCLVWDKRPDPMQPTLIDDLFGTSQAPGFWRKAVTFLNMSWQSFFVFGAPVVQVSEPLSARSFREEVPEADTAEAAELLRDRLEELLAQERQVIMGPPLQKTRDVKETVLRKQATAEAIRKVAADEGLPEAEIRERALAQLNEIAADFSLLWIKALGACLSPLFYLIYRGFHIDMDGLHRLRDVARGTRVILVPSHKSHIDYLVLSYVFYQHGLMPPHIAAGVNLSFWPVGPFFRHCGAFFLRRTFKGDALYPTVFRQYLVKLLEDRVMIEFFVEGTRSRTGKVIKPRLGMLRMLLDAFVEGRFDELVFQPISIGYEKVVEGSSYRREALGDEKKAESAAGLLKASSVLTSNYGRVFIEFAEPIKLSDYLQRYAVDRDEPEEKELQKITVRLGHRIVYDIAEATPVTPTALVALVLLAAPGKGIGTDRLHIEVGFALHVLLDPAKAARISTPLEEALSHSKVAPHVAAIRRGEGRAMRQSPERQGRDKALGESLAEVLRQAVLLLEQNDLVDIKEVQGELFYEPEPNLRSELVYYKNNIIHFLVPEALLACALLAEEGTTELSRDEAQERSLFISKLFKHEFFYRERSREDVERTQFEAAFDKALQFLVGCGWIELDAEAGLLRVPEHGRTALEFFRGLILPYIEPYRYATRRLDLLLEGAGDNPNGMERREFIKALLRQARIDDIQGEVHATEAMTKPTFENVLQYLAELGVLEATTVPGRRGKPLSMIHVHPEWRQDDQWKRLAEEIERFSGRPRRKLSEIL